MMHKLYPLERNWKIYDDDDEGGGDGKGFGFDFS